MTSDKIFSYNEENGKFDIVVDTTDNSKWTVIRQESYSLDKHELIMRKFNEDFPQFNVENYKMLTDACSRSESMTLWLINANLTYSEESQVPLFVKDIIEPEHFVKLQSDLTLINKKVSEVSLEKRALVENYKKRSS
jgi:hypothetical protein